MPRKCPLITQFSCNNFIYKILKCHCLFYCSHKTLTGCGKTEKQFLGMSNGAILGPTLMLWYY